MIYILETHQVVFKRPLEEDSPGFQRSEMVSHYWGGTTAQRWSPAISI